MSTFKAMGAGCPSSLLRGMAFQRAIVFSDIISKQMVQDRALHRDQSCDGLNVDLRLSR